MKLRKRIRQAPEAPYKPAKGDTVTLVADPDGERGTVLTVGLEQAEVRWPNGVNGGWYPFYYLRLATARLRKRIEA